MRMSLEVQIDTARFLRVFELHNRLPFIQIQVCASLISVPLSSTGARLLEQSVLMNEINAHNLLFDIRFILYCDKLSGTKFRK